MMADRLFQKYFQEMSQNKLMNFFTVPDRVVDHAKKISVLGYQISLRSRPKRFQMVPGGL